MPRNFCHFCHLHLIRESIKVYLFIYKAVGIRQEQVSKVAKVYPVALFRARAAIFWSVIAHLGWSMPDAAPVNSPRNSQKNKIFFDSTKTSHSADYNIGDQMVWWALR